MEEVHRILKSGGYFVIADVQENSNSQRFFDEIVDTHSSTGHEYDFLTPEWAAQLGAEAGLRLRHSALHLVSRVFWDWEECLAFFLDLFDLRIGAEALQASIERLLAPSSAGAVLSVPFEVAYYVLEKR